MPLQNSEGTQSIKRIRVWYGVLIFIMAVFLVRLFYLQIIRYSHYKNTALSDQLKQYEIPPTRGTVLGRSGGQTIPLVLNQKLYTLYADPVYVKDAAKAADAVAKVAGGEAASYEKSMNQTGTRYTVLAKKLSQKQKEDILRQKLPGLGVQPQDYRIYPQGTMAAQLLGFVNDNGAGTYGVEQSLDDKLKGQPGELKAITDVEGVPLAANSGNVQRPAVAGDDVVLTIDLPMQKQLEQILEKGVKKSKAEGGSALIMDPGNGEIKAMAGFPSYDPSKYFEVENAAVFNNPAVTDAIEVGSIMKSLTTAAALDAGVIRPTTTYYDPAKWKINDFNITNIEEDGGAGTRSIADILNLSLNTGVTWQLMQMGGGSINQKARETWYGYMTDRYRFGRATGIEQGYESAGFVPKPDDTGAGINLTYANTSFGQAMTATPVQMAAAMAAVVNGGTYYQPRLVDALVDASGQTHEQASKVLRKGVVSGRVTQELIPLLQYVVDKHNIVPAFDQSKYTVGGKTGTAQIAKPGGGYFENDFNGTYLGFVGGARPQYVIAVFVNKPKTPGYAGTAAAQPIFGELGHMLINNSYVSAKK